MALAADVAGRLAAAVAPLGLDLSAVFSTAWYNARVEAKHALPCFPATCSTDRGNLAVLLGNTRALWPPLLRHLQQQAGSATSLHPVDDYVSGVVLQGLATLVPDPDTRQHHTAVRWSADTRPGKLVSFQKIAHHAGLAYLHQACHLCVHKTVGPWLALRAVVVFDLPPPPDHAYAPPVMPISASDAARIEAMTNALLTGPATWRDWLALRRAVPIGQAYCYPDDMLRYHYTKDRSMLPTAGQDDCDDDSGCGIGRRHLPC